MGVIQLLLLKLIKLHSLQLLDLQDLCHRKVLELLGLCSQQLMNMQHKFFDKLVCEMMSPSNPCFDCFTLQNNQ